jgi:hypothetical protein
MKLAIESLQRRDVERTLADELAYARERARLAKMRLRETLRSRPSKCPAPSYNLRLERLGKEYVEAAAALHIALEQWTAFVLAFNSGGLL